MYLKSFDERECCGCTACSTACPKQIIQMKYHADGFMFPQIIQPAKCISCNLCERVCPMSSFQKSGRQSLCYYGWCKDSNIRSLSTSGGAFSALSLACISMRYDIVYGAAFDSEGVLIHKGVPINDYSTLRGTKYVQSYLGDCFQRISSELKNGKKILFVGTPCQVEGLLLLVKNKENLFTVSLVCHNTASPAAFKKYYDQIKNDKKVSLVRFRDKSGASNAKGLTTLVRDDGTEISESENPYTTAFGIGLMNRMSCQVCPFTTVYRNSDFTIGDFWGLEDRMPELRNECKKGISLLIAHSERANRIVPLLEKYMLLSEVPIEYAINEKQPQLSQPAKENHRRKVFLKKILRDNSDFSKTAKLEISIWRIKNRVRRYLHIDLS